ncbi:MAG: DUF4416 family protein [candidate division WOR-3 bacterium]|uniref:DUF4416 family protein n=1 Tax=candidate division WOR-3 bacterium TaxID=2052148 RepID=A0A7C1SER3_UNCW3|nr:DUF4416 family protein [candidate division WOR-3 bacterium]
MIKPARLLIAVLARQPELINTAEPELISAFGPILLRSPVINWNFSRYYEPEMGPDLVRQWLLFQPPVLPYQLSQLKDKTMEIEDRFRDENGNRRLNLDPGILTLHNLVLATTKDYSHRIALTPELYAEVTLIFHQGNYQPLPWTYPDYKTETCLNFLSACRRTLLAPAES